MDKEDIFAKKVVGALEEGLSQLDPETLSKLSQARARAMQAHGRGQNAALPQGGGSLAWAGSGGRLSWLSPRAAAALVALALCLSGWSAHSSWVNANAEEAADLDAQILADDAPLQAYSDPLFSMTIRQGLLKDRSAGYSSPD